jgi:hypothetical protein
MIPDQRDVGTLDLANLGGAGRGGSFGYMRHIRPSPTPPHLSVHVYRAFRNIPRHPIL